MASTKAGSEEINGSQHVVGVTTISENRRLSTDENEPDVFTRRSMSARRGVPTLDEAAACAWVDGKSRMELVGRSGSVLERINGDDAMLVPKSVAKTLGRGSIRLWEDVLAGAMPILRSLQWFELEDKRGIELDCKEL